MRRIEAAARFDVVRCRWLGERKPPARQPCLGHAASDQRGGDGIGTLPRRVLIEGGRADVIGMALDGDALCVLLTSRPAMRSR